MASTEDIEAKLCAYVEGEALDAEGRAEIENYLAANPQSRVLIEQLRAARSVLQGLPRETAPEDVADVIQGQLERSVLLAEDDAENTAVAGRISRWPQFMSLAAIVMLALGLAAVIYVVLPDSSTNHNYIARDTDSVPFDTGRGDAAGSGATGESATQPPMMARTAPGAGPGAVATTPPPSSDSADAALEMARVPAPSDIALAPTEAPAASEPIDIFAPPLADANESNLLADQLRLLQERLRLSSNAAASAPSPAISIPSMPADANNMFVVVTASDPSNTNREITRYLATNRIEWEMVPADAPEPLVQQAQQVKMFSQSSPTQMQVTSGPADTGMQGQAPQEFRARDLDLQAPSTKSEQVIVARQITKSQAVALQNSIEQQPGVQRAALFEGNSQGVDAESLNRNLSLETRRTGSRTGGAEAARAAAARAARQQQAERAESQTGAVMGGAGAALRKSGVEAPADEADKDQILSADTAGIDPTTQPAQIGGREPLQAEREERTTPESLGTTAPATQPAPASELDEFAARLDTGADELVDLVIVLQDEPASAAPEGAGEPAEVLDGPSPESSEMSPAVTDVPGAPTRSVGSEVVEPSTTNPAPATQPTPEAELEAPVEIFSP